MPHCAVPSCTKIGGHKFPKDPTVLKKWLVAIGRENFSPTGYSTVCRNHFTSEDYELPKCSELDKPRLKLKPDAVPSKFPWNDPFNFNKHTKRMMKACRTRDIKKKKQIKTNSQKKTTKSKEVITKVRTAALKSKGNLEVPKSTGTNLSQKHPYIQGKIIRELIPIKASDIKAKSLKLIPIKSSDIKILNINTLTNKSQNKNVTMIKNVYSDEYFISSKNVLVANKACQVNINCKLKTIETTFTCNRYISNDTCEAGIQIDIAPKLILIKASDIQIDNKNNKQLNVSKLNETDVNNSVYSEFVNVSTIKTEPGSISDQYYDVPIVKSKKIRIKDKLRIKSEELRIKSEDLRIKSEELSEDEKTNKDEFNEDPLIKEELMDETSYT